MLLAQPTEVAIAMGVVNSTANPGILINAQSALEQINPILAGMIDSSFDKAEWLDIFDFDTSLHGLNYFPLLRLSHGFVDKDSVVVSINGEAVPSDKIIVDAEKGLVFIRYALTGGLLTINVEYAAGFDIPTGDPPQVYEEVPHWLSRAAIMGAHRILQVNQGNTQRMTVSLKDLTGPLRVLMSGIVNPHVRPRYAEWPTATVQL